MLNERPLDKIAVKDIVTACEINRNTFYYYYADLYAVLSEIYQSELQRSLTRMTLPAHGRSVSCQRRSSHWKTVRRFTMFITPSARKIWSSIFTPWPAA